jgi:hypothetical protein
VSIKRLPLLAALFLLLAQGGLRARWSDFKWQMANGKIQIALHWPFAICYLPFEIPLSGGLRPQPKNSPQRPQSSRRRPEVSFSVFSVPSVVHLSFAAYKEGAPTKSTQTNNPPASFDLQSYTSELERWSASANRLGEHPQEAAALRKQLPDSWLVTAQEQRFRVSTRPLGAALDRLIGDPRTAEGAAREISARVEWLLEDARAMSRTSIRDDSRARAKLDEILARREFRFVREPSEPETFWDRLTNWLWEWISGLLSRAGGHPKVANILRWGIVVVLGLILLAWVIYTLTHVPYRRFPAPTAPTPAAPWRDWAQQARGAAARGEFREAIRIIYGAAVILLGEAGAWQVDPSRTHREYVHLLPADSVHRPHLIAITNCFEQVWYGRAPASARDYEAALAELESLA